VDTFLNKELGHVAEFCMDADSDSGRLDGGRGRMRERPTQQVKSQRFTLRFGREQRAVGRIVPLVAQCVSD